MTFPEARKPGGMTWCLATGLDGGLEAHAIFSLDRKLNRSRQAGGKRLPPKVPQPLDLRIVLRSLGFGDA